MCLGRPLIRPSCRRHVFDTTATFSPRGEGVCAASQRELVRRISPLKRKRERRSD
jgi:hypothetical protein